MRRPHFTKTLLCGITLWLVTLPAFCQNDDPIQLSMTLDKAFATVGDQLTLQIIISHSPQLNIIASTPSNPLSNFKIKKTDITEPITLQNGWLQKTYTYTFTSFQIGDYIIGPVQTKYRDPEGIEKSITSDRLYLTIESVVQKIEGGGTDIRDIKGVLSIPSRTLRFVLIILFSILTLLLGLFLYSRIKSGKGFLPSKPVILEPHEEAFHRLHKLKDSSMLRDGHVKEFYIELSETIRYYLSRRYYIDTLDLTTSELIRKLGGLNLSETTLAQIQNLLSDCDVVKFAKYHPEFAETRKHIQSAITIVETTKLGTFVGQMPLPTSETKP